MKTRTGVADQTRDSPGAVRSAVFGVPLDIPPMEARSAEELPAAGGPWQYEPKWDGFRCLVFKSGNSVELRAKSGKPLGRYFPEVIAFLRELRITQFVLDGELVIESEGGFSFDALQMRLHPAESRIRKLAAETPARLIAFDLLVDLQGTVLLGEPLSARRKALERLIRKAGVSDRLDVSPMTLDRKEAEKWLQDSGGETDGVVAKQLDGWYLPGERTMIKVKRIRTADCVVGGFRYASKKREVGSLLLGLYDAEGMLNHVGFTSNIPTAERPKLTRELEKLRSAPGFTGKAPGGPSRWSTERSSEWEPLQPKLVVEVRYDHVSGDRFRHGTGFVRWRPDKSPKQCTFEQIAPPSSNKRKVAVSAGKRTTHS
jgi:ATP-dependent DNA ligase